MMSLLLGFDLDVCSFVYFTYDFIVTNAAWLAFHVTILLTCSLVCILSVTSFSLSLSILYQSILHSTL